LRATSGKSSSKYAILSNTIVLVLIGFFLLLYFHSGNITNLLKEKINIIVEINKGSDTKKIARSIEELPQVLKGSIKNIPSTEAEKILGLNEGIIFSDSGKIFKDIITFNVSSNFYEEATLLELKNNLKQLEGISDLFYENVEIANIKSNIKNVSFFLLILSLIFIILALVIMYNTIRLSLYADQAEIKTMVIIGAKDSFIRQPYIKLAGGVAFKSFAIASVLLVIIMFWCIFSLGLVGIIKWYYVSMALLIIFIISMLICVGSTVAIVNSYLDEEYKL
jgi:cell division transport system permease protein